MAGVVIARLPDGQLLGADRVGRPQRDEEPAQRSVNGDQRSVDHRLAEGEVVGEGDRGRCGAPGCTQTADSDQPANGRAPPSATAGSTTPVTWMLPPEPTSAVTSALKLVAPVLVIRWLALTQGSTWVSEQTGYRVPSTTTATPSALLRPAVAQVRSAQTS